MGICVLAFNIQKATVYFLLAVISGFLLGSTCICGHWIALKLAPITNESNKAGKGVQTDDVGGIRLSGMTASLSSNQSHPRTTSGIVRRPTNTNRTSYASSNNNPFIVESDNGKNCELLSQVMEDERVSTVASTAPDRTLLLSASHHRAAAPRYRSPPPYSQIRSGASKSSVNRYEYGNESEEDDDDYAEYKEEVYRRKSSPFNRKLRKSQERSDQIYYTHEYTPRRQLESRNGTMKSTTTLNSIRHNDSLNRLYNECNHPGACDNMSSHAQRQPILSAPTPHHRFSWIFVRETLV